MKAVVFTLGCKVNECESDSLIAELTARGVVENLLSKLEPELEVIAGFSVEDVFQHAGRRKIPRSLCGSGG